MEMDFFAPGEESRPRNVSPDERERGGGPMGKYMERRGKEERKTQRLLTHPLKMKYEQEMAITFVGQFCLLFLSRQSVVFYCNFLVSFRFCTFPDDCRVFCKSNGDYRDPL